MIETARTSTRTTLSDVLLVPEPSRVIEGLNFGNVAAFPSNVTAIDAALQFVAGRHLFAAIVGPSGWGKSHLLHAAAGVATRVSGETVEVLDTDVFLSGTRSFEKPSVLILDDAQVVIGRQRARLDLWRLLEGRQRRGKATLLGFTPPPGSMPTRSLRAVQELLPNPRTWSVASLGEPSRDERVLLVHYLARAEDLALGETLGETLAREVSGNGRTLVGALRRLRLEGSDWTGSERCLQALGVLDPFFADNPAWDLRHRIASEAERQRLRFAAFSSLELACYTMLVEARLCERSVSQYLGREPAEVYLLASRFRRSLEGRPEAMTMVRQFVDAVVNSLTR